MNAGRPLLTTGPGWAQPKTPSHGPVLVADTRFSELSMAGTRRGGAIPQRLMQACEESVARTASHVVVVTEAFGRILARRGLTAERITVIPNGVLVDKTMDPQPISRNDDDDLLEIVHAWRPTFAYLGTLGLSQDVAELVPVFGERRRERLLIVGDGADAGRVRTLAAQYVETVRVHGAVAEHRVTPLYQLIDFHIVKLRCTPEFSATLPSKLFRIAGQGGLPLFIGPEGEAAEFVRRIDPRLVCHSVETLSERLGDLSLVTASELHHLKKRARELVVRHYDRRVQAERYLSVISDVLTRSKSLGGGGRREHA